MNLLLLGLLGGLGALVLSSKASSSSGSGSSSSDETPEDPKDEDTPGDRQGDDTADERREDAPAEEAETSWTMLHRDFQLSDLGISPRRVKEEPIEKEPSSDTSLMVVVLEPGPGYKDGLMEFCTFEGRFQVRLPPGATWASPDAAEVYLYEHEEGTGGFWSWNIEGGESAIGTIQLTGTESPIIDAHNNYWSASFRWKDASGVVQRTKVRFIGPDRPGIFGEDGYALCDFAYGQPSGCKVCEGRTPGSRLPST